MFKDDDDAAATLMGDFTMNGLIMFVMMLIILLPFIADPQEKLNSANVDPPHQGQLRVEIFWPDDMNIDVDLWVKGPIGGPVGYSNKGNELFNLLRDDLGTDLSGRNMEVAYTRGLWDGEYIVNVHLFDKKQGTTPLPVRVIVSFKENEDSPSTELFYSDVELRFRSHEITVFRFMVEDGAPVIDSLNNLPIRLRG